MSTHGNLCYESLLRPNAVQGQASLWDWCLTRCLQSLRHNALVVMVCSGERSTRSTQRITERDTAQTERILTRLVITTRPDSRSVSCMRKENNIAQHPCIASVPSCVVEPRVSRTPQLFLSPHFAHLPSFFIFQFFTFFTPFFHTFVQPFFQSFSQSTEFTFKHCHSHAHLILRVTSSTSHLSTQNSTSARPGSGWKQRRVGSVTRLVAQRGERADGSDVWATPTAQSAVSESAANVPTKSGDAEAALFPPSLSFPLSLSSPPLFQPPLPPPLPLPLPHPPLLLPFPPSPFLSPFPFLFPSFLFPPFSTPFPRPHSRLFSCHWVNKFSLAVQEQMSISFCSHGKQASGWDVTHSVMSI